MEASIDTSPLVEVVTSAAVVVLDPIPPLLQPAVDVTIETMHDGIALGIAWVQDLAMVEARC